MTDLLPTGAIRLDHLVQKAQSSPDQMTTSEKTHLSVAQCNGNAVLEISDFYTEGGCYTPTADEVMRGYDPQAVFQRYRLEVIDSIVRSKITSLKQDLWPEEDIQTLVKMIAQEATAVLDISKMVDDIFIAMANQPYNVKGLLVFARIYITVYNFGEAHKTWVASGKHPALPGNETEIFVTKTLERLKEGKIRISIMPEEWSITGVEMFYHFRNNFIFIPLEFFRDPLMISSRLGNWITAVILHELYHSHQDAEMLPLSDLDSEIEAEIFGSRAGIILHGYEEAKISLVNVIRTVRENISETKASGDVGPVAQVVLHLGIVDTVEDHMRFGLLEVSRSELERGETDWEGRKKFRERYTRQIAIFYLQSVLSEFNFRDVNPNEHRIFRTELESRFSSEENITEKVLVPKVKITTGGANVIASAENYGREGVRQLYAIYYLRGLEAAVTFLNDVFLPDYVSYYGKVLEVTMRENDGLNPK